MGRRGNRCRAPTTYRSIRQTVNVKAYRRFSLDIILEGAGNEDIFWYAPGPAADSVLDWTAACCTSTTQTASRSTATS